MKKIINLVLVLLLAMNLVACSSPETEYTYEDIKSMLEVIPVTTENINDYIEWYEYERAGDESSENPQDWYLSMRALKLKDGYAVSFHADDKVVINFNYQFDQYDVRGKTSIPAADGEATIPCDLAYEEVDENSMERRCNIWSIELQYGKGTPIYQNVLVSFEITNARGNIYHANIPEDVWHETTETVGDYTIEELGRHITIVNKEEKFVLYENGVLAGSHETAIHFTNVSYALLIFVNSIESNQTTE